MNLSINSLHYKLYSFVFGKELPDNFCKYFWRTVIAPILLPIAALGKISRIDKNESNLDQGIVTISALFILATIIAGIAGITIALISLAFLFYSWNQLGFFILLITIGIIIYSLLKGYASLIKNYVIAIKDQYCPKITWNDQ